MFILNKKIGIVRSIWMLVLACGLFIIFQILFSFPGFFLYRTNQINNGSLIFPNDPWVELLMNGGGVVGGIICSFLLWKYVNKRKFNEIGFYATNKNQAKEFIFGLCLGGLSMTFIFIIFLFMGWIDLNGSLLEPRFSIYSLTYLLLFILVGFSEEIFFRGYVMKTMEQCNIHKLSIYIVSSLIFSIFHSMNPNVTILSLINIFLVGLLFAYMYDVTKSLWMPIGYHITWNYFQGNVFGFPVSGTTPHGLYYVTVDNNLEVVTGGNFGPEGGVIATAMIIVSGVLTNVFLKRREQM